MRILNHEIAEQFYTSEEYKRNLIYHTEYKTFYLWQNGWYQDLPLDDFSKIVWNYIKKFFSTQNITASLVKDVVEQVRWGCLRKVSSEDQHYIAFKDKLFNIKTFDTEEFALDKICTYYLPYLYDEINSVATPFFDNYLKTSLVMADDFNKPDDDLIDLVQEMFGYFFLPTMYGSTAWFLVGEGANGKSVMANLIKEMIGQKYVSAMTIQSLTTDKFKATHLLGKKVNISNEEESKYVSSDKFKALITGEMINAEYKFGESFDFIPKTKFLFCSNRLPTFEGMNYALARRMKIIPFFRKFKPGEANIYLAEKLKDEIPGILRWALDGANKVIVNDYKFSYAETAKNAMYEFENETSSSLRFFRENYVVDNNEFMNGEELYSHYKEWSLTNGKKFSNKYNFIHDLMANIESIAKIRKYYGNSNLRGFNIKKSDETDGIGDSDGTNREADIKTEQLKF